MSAMPRSEIMAEQLRQDQALGISLRQTDNGVVCSMSRSGNVFGERRDGELRLATQNRAAAPKLYHTREAKADACSITSSGSIIQNASTRRSIIVPIEFERDAGLA
jgi:hypothetical protein